MGKWFKQMILILMLAVMLPVASVCADVSSQNSRALNRFKYGSDLSYFLENNEEIPVLGVDNRAKASTRIYKINVSNPEVLRYRVAKNVYSIGKKARHRRQLWISFLNPGSSRLSFTADDNGSIKRYFTTVHIAKYSNPFKKLKIGNKNFARCYNNIRWSYRTIDEISYYHYTKEDLGGKIKVQMNPGWKLREIHLYMVNNNEQWDDYGDDLEEGNIVLNGSKVALNWEECPTFAFVLEHKETGGMFFFKLMYGELD